MFIGNYYRAAEKSNVTSDRISVLCGGVTPFGIHQTWYRKLGETGDVINTPTETPSGGFKSSDWHGDWQVNLCREDVDDILSRLDAAGMSSVVLRKVGEFAVIVEEA